MIIEDDGLLIRSTQPANSSGSTGARLRISPVSSGGGYNTPRDNEFTLHAAYGYMRYGNRFNDNTGGHRFYGDDAGGSNRLILDAAPTFVRLYDSGSLKLATTNTGITCYSSCNSSSDGRKKEQVKTLDSALAKVLKLRGVSFVWKKQWEDHAIKPGVPQIGLIAQEVEKIFPEVVSEDSEGYKAVSYDHLAAPLIEAVKEVWGHVQGNTSKIEALEAENKALRVEINSIKAMLAK